MAVPAVHAQRIHVQAVTVWDGLFGSVPYVGVFRRKVVPDNQYGDQASGERAAQRDMRQHVDFPWKDLWHIKRRRWLEKEAERAGAGCLQVVRGLRYGNAGLTD